MTNTLEKRDKEDGHAGKFTQGWAEFERKGGNLT